MLVNVFFVWVFGFASLQMQTVYAEKNTAIHFSDSLSHQLITVHYFDAAKVEGPQIFLSDIADIHGEPAIVQRLRTLPVAQSAHFGLTRLLDADRIYADYLKSYAGNYQIEYEPKIIHVSSIANVLAKDSLLQLIHAFMEDTTTMISGHRDFEIVQIPDSIYIPKSPSVLRIQFASKRQKGKVDLFLAIEKDHKVLRKIPFSVNIRLYEKVIVAKEKILPGTVLTRDLIMEELRETTLLVETPLNNLNSALGAVTKQSLASGRIIIPRVLSLAPIVHRGQSIKLQYCQGNFKITTDGISRQDGVPGQIISAKNLATQKLVRCKVNEQGFLEPLTEGQNI
jgi:flagellar basal body P-ring formation protein FlgA